MSSHALHVEQDSGGQPSTTLRELSKNSPLARRLFLRSEKVKDVIRQAGGSNVRVFGSVATGQDTENSDIDLLFTMNVPLSLMELVRLENWVEELLDSDVDLLNDSSLLPFMKERVLSEVIPL